MVLGRMDAGFMFTYAFGAPLAGQLGDMYDPSMILGVGLYGSAACIFMLIFGMWNHLGESGPFIANTYFLGVYLVFGFFQAIGGPVGTAIMGNWMVTPEARRNRGLIYGTWTTHQYLGNIIAPVIIVRSRRPAVLRCLHAIDATRVHLMMKWVVSFSTLRPFRAGRRSFFNELSDGAAEVLQPSLPAERCRKAGGSSINGPDRTRKTGRRVRQIAIFR